jgi:adenosylcobinamide kinase/adenosylcobinamide-phosphate guanylyltransferase
VITLVLGGARSGKSAIAERLAAGAAGLDAGVTYVATIWPLDGAPDPDLAARVDSHRSRRPDHWPTVEPPYDLVDVLRSTDGVVLIDSLGSWLSAQPDMAVDRDALAAALAGRSDPTFVVSDEVGWGVHPETETGRRFRDELGALNHAVADLADEVLVAVAGRVLRGERW